MRIGVMIMFNFRKVYGKSFVKDFRAINMLLMIAISFIS